MQKANRKDPINVAAQSVIAVNYMYTLYIHSLRLLNFVFVVDFFLLSYYGFMGSIRASRTFTGYFKRHSKYHITQTVMRKIVELIFMDGQERGIVTEKHCRSVRNTLGHSAATVAKFYQPTAR